MPIMPKQTLSGKQKRFLRELAHPMKPIINIGKNGLSDALYKQVVEGLLQHELLKVKILESCPTDKKECATQVSENTESHIVQVIGRTIVLYKTNPEEPSIELPKS